MLDPENRISMEYVKALLANKYVFTFVIFMVWMLFFDKNNLIVLSELQHTIDDLVEEKEYFDSELMKLDDQMKSIQVDRERYAREEYHLHKANEVVYIVRDKPLLNAEP